MPGLRNVELTGPYFHNGDSRTLEEVVDFYTRGGNFPAENINNLDFNITPLGVLQNAPLKHAALVAFMKSFTDERVRNESAPFDHPELFIPNGDPEVLIRIPARDANGNAAVSIALTNDPVISPTNRQNLPISGTKEVGATVQVKVGNGTAVTADSPTATTWSATLVGLAEGINTISVSSTDLNGIITTATKTVILDITLPLLNLTPVPATLRGDDIILSGTVETGIIPVVTVSTPGAAVGTVTITGAAWSAPVSLLTVGANGITVTATDLAGNVTTVTASIFMLADGIFNGTRVADISDAIKALRIAVKLIPPTANDLLHGDVAPLGVPDGIIDLSDVLLIMRNVVGTINLSN